MASSQQCLTPEKQEEPLIYTFVFSFFLFITRPVDLQTRHGGWGGGGGLEFRIVKKVQ